MGRISFFWGTVGAVFEVLPLLVFPAIVVVVVVVVNAVVVVVVVVVAVHVFL